MSRLSALACACMMLFKTVPVHADESALKSAFANARLSGKIEDILPAFRTAQLYVVARSDGKPDDMQDLYLVPSPRKDRMCVTVAEHKESLARIDWPKRRIAGRILLDKLPKGVEIVVVYPDGGDYLTREHLEWFQAYPEKP